MMWGEGEDAVIFPGLTAKLVVNPTYQTVWNVQIVSYEVVIAEGRVTASDRDEAKVQARRWVSRWFRAVADKIQEPISARTRLVNVKYDFNIDVYIGRKEAGDFYFGDRQLEGRDGYFGNPFGVMGTFNAASGEAKFDRDSAIDMYRDHFAKRIAEDREFRARIESLRGKTLGCWCAPARCHGDVIIEYLEGK